MYKFFASKNYCERALCVCWWVKNKKNKKQKKQKNNNDERNHNEKKGFFVCFWWVEGKKHKKKTRDPNLSLTRVLTRQQQLFVATKKKKSSSNNNDDDDDKTENTTCWIIVYEWDEKTAPFLSSIKRRERFGFIRCDWCRLDDVFLGVYDRVVEQQYSFEKKEQGALREGWRRGGVILRRRDDDNKSV